MKQLRVLLLPLDGMLVHQHYVAGTRLHCIHLGGERDHDGMIVNFKLSIELRKDVIMS